MNQTPNTNFSNMFSLSNVMQCNAIVSAADRISSDPRICFFNSFSQKQKQRRSLQISFLDEISFNKIQIRTLIKPTTTKFRMEDKANRYENSMECISSPSSSSSAISSKTRTTMTPLSEIAVAFEDLEKLLNSRDSDGDLQLDTFTNACSFVSILFSCLGLSFKFAELEYVAKVRDLVEASKQFKTLRNIIELDIANNTVKAPGSHTRNLRRVRQGLDLIRALFEQFLTTDDYSLKEAASTAYGQVCAPYHSWAVRTAVSAGMYTLPNREQLLQKLNETDQSAEKKMRRYIIASTPVIKYIDKLYISRNISLDW